MAESGRRGKPGPAAAAATGRRVFPRADGRPAAGRL